MKIFITLIKKTLPYYQQDTVVLQTRAEGNGGMIGDAFKEVVSGQEAHGYTFDELKNNNDGYIDID